MHAGVTTDEVRERFSAAGWELASAEQVSTDAIEVAGRRADQRFELWRFRLHHRGTSGADPAAG
jgi:hypothetical protein